MNGTLSDMDPERRRAVGNVSLDALAVIGALYRDDVESANVMLRLYQAEDGELWDVIEVSEFWGLIQACFAHCTRVLRSFVADPEMALQAMAEAIRLNS